MNNNSFSTPLATFFGIILLSAVGSASAQTVEKSISISPFGASLSDNAQMLRGFRAGILMDDPAGNPDNRSSFYFGFTIPEDFAPGSMPVVRIIWSTGGESCNLNLRSNALTRHDVDGGPSDTGSLSSNSGLPLVSNDTSEHGNTAIYTPVSVGVFAPGDAVTASLFRSEVNDTCPNVVIHGIAVVYDSLGPLVFQDAFEN